jgi:hypothetical protein
MYSKNILYFKKTKQIYSKRILIATINHFVVVYKYFLLDVCEIVSIISVQCYYNVTNYVVDIMFLTLTFICRIF